MADAIAGVAIGAPGSRKLHEEGRDHSDEVVRRSPGRFQVANRPRRDPGFVHLVAWLERLPTLFRAPWDLAHLGAEVLKWINEFYPSSQSALLIQTSDSDQLEVVAARGHCMSDDEAIWVERMARESLQRCEVLGRESSAGALSSFLWVPLLCEGEAVGAIQLADRSRHCFSRSAISELSRIADAVGSAARWMQAASKREKELVELREQLAQRTRECFEGRQELARALARDGMADMAIQIAEQATDPSSYVLCNVRSARESVDLLQDHLPALLDAATQMLESLSSCAQDGPQRVLRERLNRAADAHIGERLWDLMPLLEEVETGAKQLCGVGFDFRELALGDGAPVSFIDLGDVIRKSIEMTERSGKGSIPVELRISDLPLIQCQRLRIQGLVMGMLSQAMDGLGSEGGLRVQAEAQGERILVEVSAEGVRRESHPGGRDPFSILRETAEDHGGALTIAQLEDQLSLQLSLPVVRD